eukprot:273834-Chlamydomonas_euryale.AAC.8
MWQDCRPQCDRGVCCPLHALLRLIATDLNHRVARQSSWAAGRPWSPWDSALTAMHAMLNSRRARMGWHGVDQDCSEQRPLLTAL